MSHISLAVSDGNPVTQEAMLKAFSTISTNQLSLPEKDLKDYTTILAGSYEVFDKIMKLPDYVPIPDTMRFPRENVHRPQGEENKRNAWAWKATVVDKSEEAKAGLLAGKTISLKDNIALAGVPATLGSDMVKDFVPDHDATIVTRILKSGATITGKAACENMSFFGASMTSSTGPMSNYYGEGYSAGGSSSGSALLVASGETWGSMGGDQGGSIRLPASQNGIVGFKPTHGLIPYTGIALVDATIDTTGPMTKTVLDNALLLQVTAGADGIDDRQQSGCPSLSQVPDYVAEAKKGIKGLKIGILQEGLKSDLADKRISDLTVKAAQTFVEQGAVVEECSVGESHALAVDLWMVIARMSVYQNMTGKACGRRALYQNGLQENLLPLSQEQIDVAWPSILITLCGGSYAWEKFPPSLVGKAMNLARKVRDDYNALLEKYDVLVMPTMQFLPRLLPTPEELKGMSPIQKMSFGAGISLNTCPFSLTGHPGLSVPIGFLPSLDERKVSLPVGMQIVGKWFDDAICLRVGYAFEQANDWKTFA